MFFSDRKGLSYRITSRSEYQKRQIHAPVGIILHTYSCFYMVAFLSTILCYLVNRVCTEFTFILKDKYQIKVPNVMSTIRHNKDDAVIMRQIEAIR